MLLIECELEKLLWDLFLQTVCFGVCVCVRTCVCVSCITYVVETYTCLHSHTDGDKIQVPIS